MSREFCDVNEAKSKMKHHPGTPTARLGLGWLRSVLPARPLMLPNGLYILRQLVKYNECL